MCVEFLSFSSLETLGLGGSVSVLIRDEMSKDFFVGFNCEEESVLLGAETSCVLSLVIKELSPFKAGSGEFGNEGFLEFKSLL